MAIVMHTKQSLITVLALLLTLALCACSGAGSKVGSGSAADSEAIESGSAEQSETEEKPPVHLTVNKVKDRADGQAQYVVYAYTIDDEYRLNDTSYSTLDLTVTGLDKDGNLANICYNQRQFQLKSDIHTLTYIGISQCESRDLAVPYSSSCTALRFDFVEHYDTVDEEVVYSETVDLVYEPAKAVGDPADDTSSSDSSGNSKNNSSNSSNANSKSSSNSASVSSTSSVAKDEIVVDTDGKTVYKVQATDPSIHFTGSFTGAGHFSIWVLDSNQDYYELVCNEIGDWQVDKSVSVTPGNVYYLQFETTEGQWTCSWSGTGGN